MDVKTNSSKSRNMPMNFLKLDSQRKSHSPNYRYLSVYNPYLKPLEGIAPTGSENSFKTLSSTKHAHISQVKTKPEFDTLPMLNAMYNSSNDVVSIHSSSEIFTTPKSRSISFFPKALTFKCPDKTKQRKNEILKPQLTIAKIINTQTFQFKTYAFEIPEHPIYYSFKKISFETCLNSNSSTQVQSLQVDLPSILQYSSVKYNTKVSFPCKELQPIPLSSSDPDFETILKAKIAICSEFLDFSDPNAQLIEKEMKSKTLCEFIELFESQKRANELSEQQLNSIFQSIYSNISEQVVDFPCSFLSSIASPSPISLVEPAWPHLFYCYQIINRISQLFPKMVSFSFFETILKLTQLPDSNERIQLVAILRSYYDQNPNEHQLILEKVQKLLSRFFDKDSFISPFCMMPLTIFLSHIFTRSSNNGSNYAISEAILDSILPLLYHPYLFFAYQNIKHLLIQIISLNPQSMIRIFKEIEKSWPFQSGQKQNLFIDLIISLVSVSPPDQIKPFVIRFFGFLSSCASSNNVSLAMAALDVWTRCKNDEWLIDASRSGINQMFEIAWILSKNSWSKEIQEKAQIALSEMGKLHKTQYHNFKMAIKAQQYKKVKTTTLNRSVQIWAKIGKIVSKNYPNFNYKDYIKTLKNWIENQPDLTKPTRFMSGPPCVDIKPSFMNE